MTIRDILGETMPLVFLWDPRAPNCDLIARTPHGFMAWQDFVGLTEVDCGVITHYSQGADHSRVSSDGQIARAMFAPGPIARGIYAAIHIERIN